jgi:hypothetical protein
MPFLSNFHEYDPVVHDEEPTMSASIPSTQSSSIRRGRGSAVFHCQSALHHEADRSQHAGRRIGRDDRFTARLEYRRMDSMERPFSRELRAVCRWCMEAEIGGFEPQSDQQSLL